MAILMLNGPAIEPITIAEVKAALRIDTIDEDVFVSNTITAARSYLEQATNRKIITQGWRVILDRWPISVDIALPLAPLLSVEAVRIKDINGGSATIPASSYRVDATSNPPRMVFVASRPDPGSPLGGIEIDVKVGYGAAATDVPEPLRQAMRLLIAQWFENRGDGSQAHSTALERDVAALIAPYIRRRLA